MHGVEGTLGVPPCGIKWESICMVHSAFVCCGTFHSIRAVSEYRSSSGTIAWYVRDIVILIFICTLVGYRFFTHIYSVLFVTLLFLTV